MTEKETRTEMKRWRWSFLRRKRRSREYIYAARKTHNKRVERYICPLAKLAEFPRSALLVKLDCNTFPTQNDLPVVRSENTDYCKNGQGIDLAG